MFKHKLYDNFSFYSFISSLFSIAEENVLNDNLQTLLLNWSAIWSKSLDVLQFVVVVVIIFIAKGIGNW